MVLIPILIIFRDNRLGLKDHISSYPADMAVFLHKRIKTINSHVISVIKSIYCDIKAFYKQKVFFQSILSSRIGYCNIYHMAFSISKRHLHRIQIPATCTVINIQLFFLYWPNSSKPIEEFAINFPELD